MRIKVSCPCYDAPRETINHSLRDCNFSHAVWFVVPLGLGVDLNFDEPVKDWLTSLLESKMVDFDAVLMLLWAL